jgi:glycosyltransferase involved in cell wall biosynthesis
VSDVTVLTPTIPARYASTLPECLASVAAQTDPPAAHLISADLQHRDCGPLLNDLARLASTRWVMCLADDDLIDPGHLERLTAVGEQTGAHVVYSFARFVGWPADHPAPRIINRPFDEWALHAGNYIPGGCALIDLYAWDRAGGMGLDWHLGDWHLWLTIFRQGGEFVCVPEETWSYRWHGDNKQAAA